MGFHSRSLYMREKAYFFIKVLEESDFFQISLNFMELQRDIFQGILCSFIEIQEGSQNSRGTDKISRDFIKFHYMLKEFLGICKHRLNCVL